MNKNKIFLTILFFTSFGSSQSLDYLLEDINPTSPTYGQLIGPSFFANQGKMTLNLFSHQN